MSKSVSEKLGVRINMRTYLMNVPVNFSETVKLPEVDMKARLTGSFDYIHFFVITQKDFNKTFPKLKKCLGVKGMLWVSWPKSKQKNTDLEIKKVIELGYNHGLVESKAISIDETWSAIKFTHPVNGKEYNNSYGKLK